MVPSSSPSPPSAGTAAAAAASRTAATTANAVRPQPWLCRAVHRGGGAAPVGGRQAVTWLAAGGGEDGAEEGGLLAYASHAAVHVCERRGAAAVGGSGAQPIFRPAATLRPSFPERQQPGAASAAAAPTTAVTAVASCRGSGSSNSNHYLAAAFSDGRLSVWERRQRRQQSENSTAKGGESDEGALWTEHAIVSAGGAAGDESPQSPAEQHRSVACLDVAVVIASPSGSSEEDEEQLHVAAGSSAGATVHVLRRRRRHRVAEDGGDSSSSNNHSNHHCWSLVVRDRQWLIAPPPSSGAAVSTVRLAAAPADDDEESLSHRRLLLVGTAAPRHNAIHVYHLCCSTADADADADRGGSDGQEPPHHCYYYRYGGGLTGHEDWITSLALSDSDSTNSDTRMLASGSQDARIRLWKFATTTTYARRRGEEASAGAVDRESTATHAVANQDSDGGDDDDESREAQEDDAAGESRLEIVLHSTNNQDANGSAGTRLVLSVTLEALLHGHEEAVTAVAWHPRPRRTPYATDRLLISSSMDRSLWLWAETSATAAANSANNSNNNSSVWAPVSRVGSAGGILGGPLGSSLLGFCSVVVEPTAGRTLVGHAYGGALHVWNMEEDASAAEDDNNDDGDDDAEKETERSHALAAAAASVEERAARVRWTASPCVTGHFDRVADLSWEAAGGSYLLTAGHDQTCRLWAPVRCTGGGGDSNNDNAVCWVELARPQVHGYNLSAVASVSTPQHPHRIVTGADEKELRAFDAPKTTLRLLKAACNSGGGGGGGGGGIVPLLGDDDATLNRVERAFIPSLGLSNKASAADAAEEDKDATEDGGRDDLLQTPSEGTPVSLPLERDLGAVSIWPETRKLFGHNTEIYCLASTLAARTSANHYAANVKPFNDVIVASSCKARDVEDAAIRLWDIDQGKCLQVLAGGHKSTVATLSFSPDGRFLASSGKDRRLCVWKRDPAAGPVSFSLAWAKESAHKRIVWSVHFCPFDEKLLASGSRDGCIKIWSLSDSSGDANGVELTQVFSFAPSFQRKDKPDAVTALSFAPLPMDSNTAVLALGLDSGRIELWKIPRPHAAGATAVPEMFSPSGLDPSQCHVATITKLAWRPLGAASATPPKTLQLASCSFDWGCRIFEISVTQ